MADRMTHATYESLQAECLALIKADLAGDRDPERAERILHLADRIDQMYGIVGLNGYVDAEYWQAIAHWDVANGYAVTPAK